MRNKRIIINGKFLSQRITGVQRYAREILAELDKIVYKNEIEIAIPNNSKNIPNYMNIKVSKVGKHTGIIWEQIDFMVYIIKNNGIALNLCNMSPLLFPGIVCIHDMKIKARPKDFSKKFLLWYRIQFYNSIKRAKHIITVSEFSKNEIKKYYKISGEKISVIYNSWQHYNKIKFDESVMKKYSLQKEKYYFALSSLEANKNLNWIIKTAMYNKNDLFIIAGGINTEIFRQGDNKKIPDNIKFVGYLSDEQAKILMKNCKAFLHPAFYEGFGIPPLEALSVGAEIVISDTEIMHEIYEDCANYINVNVPCRISVRKHNDKSKILNKFSWKASAEKLHKLIKIYGKA